MTFHPFSGVALRRRGWVNRPLMPDRIFSGYPRQSRGQCQTAQFPSRITDACLETLIRATLGQRQAVRTVTGGPVRIGAQKASVGAFAFGTRQGQLENIL